MVDGIHPVCKIRKMKHHFQLHRYVLHVLFVLVSTACLLSVVTILYFVVDVHDVFRCCDVSFMLRVVVVTVSNPSITS